MLCAICNSEQQFVLKMRMAYVIEVCLYKGTWSPFHTHSQTTISKQKIIPSEETPMCMSESFKQIL